MDIRRGLGNRLHGDRPAHSGVLQGCARIPMSAMIDFPMRSGGSTSPKIRSRPGRNRSERSEGRALIRPGVRTAATPSVAAQAGPAGIEPATPGFGDADTEGTPVGTRVHRSTVTSSSASRRLWVYPRVPGLLDTSWTQIESRSGLHDGAAFLLLRCQKAGSGAFGSSSRYQVPFSIWYSKTLNRSGRILSR